MVNYMNQLVKVHILNTSNYGHGIVAQLYIKQILPIIVLDEHPSPMLESVHLECQPSIVRQCHGAVKTPRKHYHQLCA